MMDPSLEYSTLLYMCIECLSVAVCTRALHQFLPYYIINDLLYLQNDNCLVLGVVVKVIH